MSGGKLKCNLVVDAGGSYFKSALINNDEALVGENISQNSQGTRGEIRQAYERVFNVNLDRAENLGTQVWGIGIGTPGPFDFKTGTSNMRHKFQAIYGLPLRELIHEWIPRTQGLPIWFIHDIHAFLLGEQHAGAARGFKNIAAATIGTGLGFGCVVNGMIRDDGAGGPCISLYKHPFKDGSLEDTVSRRGIIRLYRNYARSVNTETIDVVDIARKALTDKDEAACKAFREAGAALSNGLRDPLAELRIECLVIGGQIAKAYKAMEEGLLTGLKGIASLRKICAASNIDTATLLGIAYHVNGRLPGHVRES